MRVGEALASRWNECLKDRIIIDERLYDGDLDAPKTLHGSREVPLEQRITIPKSSFSRQGTEDRRKQEKCTWFAL